MEDLKYEYVPMHLPNVVARVSKADVLLPVVVADKLRPLIDALAIKYPNWRFVGRNIHRQNADSQKYEAARFAVYEKRELLGDLSTTWSPKYGAVYTIDNVRINKARERGAGARTKDLNKAIKIVAKTFGGKTLSERMDEALEDVNDVVYRVSGDRSSNFHRVFSGVTECLAKHILDNWEVMAPIAVANGADEAIIRKLPEYFNEYEITRKIYECKDKRKGAVVLIHGSDYAVCTRSATGSKELVTLPSDKLPQHIKVSVGMLKLVENRHFIKDVGVRVNDTTFFVTKEAEA